MFEPWQFEWPFSLPISAGDHHINFEGRIDRVDRASTDDGVALSVIDYKLRPKKDDLSMWNAGASIQLTAYLYAAVMLESTRTPNIAVIPAMAAYVPLMMHAYRPSDDNAPIDATLPAFPTQGWIDAKRHDRLYADLDPQTSPFVLPSRAVVDADIMQKALKQTAHRIRSAVTHILAGDIAVMPLRVGVRNRACAFCDFRSVCRFDPFCDRYRTVPSHAYTAALTWIGDQP
jgi:ATP-dependent helicase/nuclease subunit B